MSGSAMRTMSVAAVAALALLALLPSALGLQCYECNSATDDKCKDLVANSTDAQRFLKDCDLAAIPADKTPLCRKTVQTILAEGERRVIRRCGYERHEKECYHYDDDDHAEVVCQCFGDACNAAPGRHHGAGSTLLAAATAAALLLVAR